MWGVGWKERREERRVEEARYPTGGLGGAAPPTIF